MQRALPGWNAENGALPTAARHPRAFSRCNNGCSLHSETCSVKHCFYPIHACISRILCGWLDPVSRWLPIHPMWEDIWDGIRNRQIAVMPGRKPICFYLKPCAANSCFTGSLAAFLSLILPATNLQFIGLTCEKQTAQKGAIFTVCWVITYLPRVPNFP